MLGAMRTVFVGLVGLAFLIPLSAEPTPTKDFDINGAAGAAAERQNQLALADGIFARATPFIPLTMPVRWSLVPERLDGFRPNPFARHPAVNLIAERP